jgi:hypothetical protein
VYNNDSSDINGCDSFSLLMVHPVIADKSPQAECINSQNEQFIGKEQSGDAYKFSKDTCQSLR